LNYFKLFILGHQLFSFHCAVDKLLLHFLCFFYSIKAVFRYTRKRLSYDVDLQKSRMRRRRRRLRT